MIFNSKLCIFKQRMFFFYNFMDIEFSVIANLFDECTIKSNKINT